jgi:hypothetical protein
LLHLLAEKLLYKHIAFIPLTATSSRTIQNHHSKNINFSVRKFQKVMNNYTPGYFNPDNYGIFGNASLMAVMDIYENDKHFKSQKEGF